MTAIAIVHKGESLPFRFDRGDESIADWSCLIEIKKFTSSVASISRTILEADAGWPGFLTSTETAALATGLYRLIGVLKNTTTDEEEQVLLRFNMTESWAT